MFETILEFIQLDKLVTGFNGLVTWFNELNKTAPMVTGAISLWALTTASYLCRQIPEKIWEFLLKQFTVTLTISNNDELFYTFFEWYNEKGHSGTSRTLRATQGRWGDDKINLSAGFGNHYIWDKRKLFKVTRAKDDASTTIQVKEEVSLTTIGRSQDQFRDIMASLKIMKDENCDNMTRVYSHSLKDGWKYQCKHTPRKMDSVILPLDTKKKILDTINNFKESKPWYIDHGIPYKLGILLSGPPGTGKTSIVKAICGYFEANLYNINLKDMGDSELDQALNSIEDGVALIEDIDAQSSSTHVRKTDETGVESFFGTTLSGILNAVDGISSSEGRILVMTTNCPEKLDKALIRRGRVDLHIEIGYLTRDCILEFFSRFFPDFNVPIGCKFKEELSPAYLQGLVLENRDSPEKVLQELIVL